MIYLLVTLLLSVLRFFSWIPGVDSPIFVHGLTISVAIFIVALLDSWTFFFRNLVNRSSISGFLVLSFSLAMIATPSVWWNIAGFAILGILIFKTTGKPRKKKSFLQKVKKLIEKIEFEDETVE